jgi:F0F1-type ATP synthase assembly protein I
VTTRPEQFTPVPPNAPELTEGLARSGGSFELVVSAMAFALLGWWADAWVGTTPALTIAGAVFGFAGATVSLLYRYRARIAMDQAVALRDGAGSGSPR